MIRSTKTTLKFSNDGKLEKLQIFITEYRRVVSLFIDAIWELDKIPSLLPISITSRITSWLSARAIQCAGKQASGIVRGTQTKQKKRLWQINEFKRLKQDDKAKVLQDFYNKVNVSKPVIDNLQCELDSRFVKIDIDNSTTFDGWVTLSSLGNKLRLQLPFKKHKHFNKLFILGKLKAGVRVSSDTVTFMFDLPDAKLKEDGATLGIDIGQTTTLSCSDGQTIDSDVHGHNYKSICNKLARKKKGSKRFKKTVKHRTNYLRWVINQLNLNGVKAVNRENIKNLRRGRRSSKSLTHWNYGELFDLLDNKLTEQGVLVNKLNPTYTSQRCSSCGWVRKGNRKGKLFKCDKCSTECDADLNASINLSLNLSPIKERDRLQQFNKIGFYWAVVGEESIVSHTQKAGCLKKQ